MSIEKLQRFLIKGLCDNYSYHITEAYSKDGRQNFWMTEKSRDGLKEGLVFIDKDNIYNIEEPKYDNFIKVVIIEDMQEKQHIKIDSSDMNNVIIIEKNNNEIVYCPEALKHIGGEIYSLLNYKKQLVKKTKHNSPVITITLIGINVLLYVITAFLSNNIFDSDIDVLIFLGAKVNQLIDMGQYYRLFTAMFLHGGLMHLVLNMYALYALGPLIERVYGKIKYLVIYFVAGMISSIFSYVFSDAVSIGASGAIFGLLGSSLFFAIKMRDRLGKDMIVNILSVIGINIFIGISMSNIDNFAHIGGLIGGVIISIVLDKFSTYAS